MGYILTFIGGAMFGGLIGVVVMCCCVISGDESRREEMRDGYGQNKSDGI